MAVEYAKACLLNVQRYGWGICKKVLWLCRSMLGDCVDVWLGIVCKYVFRMCGSFLLKMRKFGWWMVGSMVVVWKFGECVNVWLWMCRSMVGDIMCKYGWRLCRSMAENCVEYSCW